MNWIKESIAISPSFNPCLDQIRVIDEEVCNNPSLCVDTCKTLIESICKTILTNKAVVFQSNISFNGLVHLTVSNILQADDLFRNDLTELARRMSSVAQALADLRNNHGFASHGLDVLNPRLTETVSQFAYKITDSIGGFILNCYLNNRVVSTDIRIHYEDCKDFNEDFDQNNPLNIGIISLSASEVLYKQDYEAYKEEYFIFLEELENQLTQNVE
ncbi:abortive infection family protein [Mangrovibacterium sp.]|uniref:abortive infection family protein n=1 Tax=Mangrovibacterium sp. TaxID=1961364 RepID=UPI00356B44BC